MKKIFKITFAIIFLFAVFFNISNSSKIDSDQSKLTVGQLAQAEVLCAEYAEGQIYACCITELSGSCNAYDYYNISGPYYIYPE